MMERECPVCLRVYVTGPPEYALLCRLCTKSLRAHSADDFSIIVWAASRARYFAVWHAALRSSRNRGR